MTIYSTHLPTWNQSIIPCLVLTVASWPAYRFLRRQVRWPGTLISLRIFHSLLWSTQWKNFSVVNEAEVFLKFSCFLYDTVDVGNLISSSSAFSKSSLYVWKFSVQVLLKHSLKDFEHNFTSMWNEHNCTVVWTFFGFAFLWNWKGNWPLPVWWPLLSFPNLRMQWIQHFNSIIF